MRRRLVLARLRGEVIVKKRQPIPFVSREDWNRAVGFVLKTLRRRAKLSQEFVTAEVGEPDRVHLSRLERGYHSPDSYLLGKLAAYYSCSLDELCARIKRRLEYYASSRQRKL